MALSDPVPARRGAVGVVRRERRFLVIRRAQGISAPGAFCFPGGGIEPGESEEAALVRELQEELGILVTPRQRLWQSVTRWGVELCWWQAELSADATLVPNPAEVESVSWLSPEEMLALDELLSSNREFLHAVERGEIVLD